MIQGAVHAALERLELLDEARAQQIVSVVSVELALGAAGHITEDIARQQYALNAIGTPLQGAELHIVWLPATYLCLSCMGRFTATTPEEETTCPDCGSVALQIAHQDICYVQAIEIEEADSAAERSDRDVFGQSGAGAGGQRVVGAYRD